ncbi:MAG: F0F1 ATP synthase subunit C [Candidatus Hydrogenedentota bacterium]|nr:MAG: F0F1 ATP synthase subunit C [Candidatus Hydrogenedentota bacterium]
MALGLGGLGAAIGMGMAAAEANRAMMRQPARQGDLLRTMLLGQAIGGSPSIFALVVGLLILFLPVNEAIAGAEFAAVLIGAGLAVGLGCLGSGIGCGLPAAAACAGVARNPAKSTALTATMMIGQALAQSPSIFATIVALILLFLPLPGTGLAAIGIAISAGIAMGASALGPGIGSGMTAGGAVEGQSHWPASRPVTVRTMLISQAICDTPAIFGMLVAFIMLFTMHDLEPTIVGFSKTFAAAIAVGMGGIGPGIGCGSVGETSCRATAEHPENDALMLRTMLIGQAVSQSTAIYALIIALVILFVV